MKLYEIQDEQLEPLDLLLKETRELLVLVALFSEAPVALLCGRS